jgi:uncharacterized protein (TIGR03435 family)
MNHDENIEEFLKQSLPSASQEQAEAAGSRVFDRLLADPGSRPNPAIVDFDLSRSNGWRWVPAMAAAAAIVIAFVWSGIAPWGEQKILRSTGASGTTFTLEDGSGVEMRAQSELSIERSDAGIRIRLEKGSVIVNAAKQEAGRHLYVQTKDVTVTVVGTVFLVNAAEEGSRVAVIEGEVRVQQQQGAEKKLLPGEQLATSPAIPKVFVEEQIGWSKNSKAHLAMLEQSATAAIQPPAQAQSATRPANTPKWEAVSIRPCGDPTNEPGVRAGGVGFRPGLLRVTCMRLRFLIEDAYVKHLEPELMRRRWIFPVEGGPSWLDTELYSIEARAEGLPSVQQLGGPMLQVLLEDRFKLKLRREIREEPVYELRVADGGFKLKPLPEGECEARKARSDAAAAALPADASIAARLSASFGECDSVGIGGPRDGSRAIEGTRTVKLTGLKVAELTNNLSLDRIIIDKTGLQGLYDIDVTYGIYNSPMREPQPIPPGMAPGGDPIFTAIEKQLGLKLVPTMGPRTYYFVESVERPTPN